MKSYRQRFVSLLAFFLLVCISMPIHSRDDGSLFGALSEEAKSKLPARFLRRAESGLPTRGFIVEFASDRVRADADQERLALGLRYENESIRKLKALAFARIRERVLSAMTGRGVFALKNYRQLPMARVQVQDVSALEELLEDEDVVNAYPDEKHKISLNESLPLIGQPSVGSAGSGVTIAVIDTGVDFTLPAFGSCTAPAASDDCKVIDALDFAPDDGSRDADGHGSFVAGVVSGVAPGAKIAALDVFTGPNAWSSDIIEAIDWALAHQSIYNIVAINLSMEDGEAYLNECPDSWATTPFANARAAGILPIVSSGNGGFPNAVSSPACAPGAVRIGAVYDDYLGGRMWQGCTDSYTAPDVVTCFSNSADFLTLFAPGAVIDAAGYQSSGTSASAPHVSGAVAVLRDAFPNETTQEILDRMIRTGVPVTDSNNQQGWPEITRPRLDLAEAAGVFDATSIMESGHTPTVVNQAWYRVQFAEEFPADPIVLAAMETYRGPDTAGLRVRKVGTSGFEVKVEEEQSKDSEINHAKERVGFLAIEAGAIVDSSGRVIGEAGSIIRQQPSRTKWHTVSLGTVYERPVVIMNIVSYADDQPAHIRLKNVGTSSFQFQVEEWRYLDGSHPEEHLHYIVLEHGRHELSDRRMAEAGTVRAKHIFKDVSFSSYLSNPTILTQSQTRNGGAAIVTRQTNGSQSGFSVKVEEEQGNDGKHTFETLGYIAIE